MKNTNKGKTYKKDTEKAYHSKYETYKRTYSRLHAKAYAVLDNLLTYDEFKAMYDKNYAQLGSFNTVIRNGKEYVNSTKIIELVTKSQLALTYNQFKQVVVSEQEADKEDKLTAKQLRNQLRDYIIAEENKKTVVKIWNRNTHSLQDTEITATASYLTARWMADHGFTKEEIDAAFGY